tara:strand:+ start:89262 stop:89630 length:369 start_codon:yes stop_codon:yes gene_type:complete
MKTIVVDLDGTLTISDSSKGYADLLPNLAVIESLRKYRELGYEIAIFTARNMRTYQKSVGLINANTLPIVLEWLDKHDIPYDEIHVGKPWCGDEGFYVDDKAIRPDEFVNLSNKEIQKLIGN